jgi:hypothetical protein
MEKLMKSTLAAASCKNVGVVIDEFVFVGLHSLEDFLPLYHAHFTVHCLCRLHAFESLSLVNDRRLDVFVAPSRDGNAAG